MQQPFPPCPICGSTQAFFNGGTGTASIYISLGLFDGIRLGALICLTCGHTELRPHPSEMGNLRAVVEKRGLIPPD